VPEEYESSQGEEDSETGFNNPYDDDLEIVEQSALDHFNSILQKAQSLAAKAEIEKPRKRPKRYKGNSERTLKRRKKEQEEFKRQGYGDLSMFGFHVAPKKAREREQAPEESAPEDSDTSSVSECVGQVRHREVLIRRDSQMRSACSQRRGRGEHRRRGGHDFGVQTREPGVLQKGLDAPRLTDKSSY
jgi:hypothetical protein